MSERFKRESDSVLTVRIEKQKKKTNKRMDTMRNQINFSHYDRNRMCVYL